jgi:hypothetical protein
VPKDEHLYLQGVTKKHAAKIVVIRDYACGISQLGIEL